MIEVKNLTKKYGSHVAVKNLSFTVEKGQVVGFLGPNGAGKSTTMNILTGYLAATDGNVSINGNDILKKPEAAKKDIGYLPEQPPLYMEMTVKEYLYFVAELKKVEGAKREEMITEIMETVKISDVKKRLIRNLSKGYKQRVGIAGALMGYPEIIILDEPTVGLDPKQIIEIRDLIKNLSQNHTVILSSHILSEISTICDKVMIIDKGSLVASDSPENLSKMILGSSCLIIRAKGTTEAIEAVLNTLSELRRFEFITSEEEGTVDMKIYAHQEADVREVIFNAFAGSGIPLLMMRTNDLTLEEIFLQITGSNIVGVVDQKEPQENVTPKEEGGEA